MAVAWSEGQVEAWDVPRMQRIGMIRFARDRFLLGKVVVAPEGRRLALEVIKVGSTWAERTWDKLLALLGDRTVRLTYGVVIVDVVSGWSGGRSTGSRDPEFSPDGRWVATREPGGAYAIRAVP